MLLRDGAGHRLGTPQSIPGVVEMEPTPVYFCRMVACPLHVGGCSVPHASVSALPPNPTVKIPMYDSCWESSGRCVILGPSPSCSGMGSVGTAGFVQKQGHSGVLTTFQTTATDLRLSGPPYSHAEG